jgi:uncharacterized protein (DUF1330 family)
MQKNALCHNADDSAQPGAGGLMERFTRLHMEARVMVYLLAQLRFTNREAYNRYQARFMDVFSKFNGRLLAADEAPLVLEGAWDREKAVLMSFPDEESARKFAESPEYQEISRDRWAGADTVALLVHGFPASYSPGA